MNDDFESKRISSLKCSKTTFKNPYKYFKYNELFFI